MKKREIFIVFLLFFVFSMTLSVVLLSLGHQTSYFSFVLFSPRASEPSTSHDKAKQLNDVYSEKEIRTLQEQRKRQPIEENGKEFLLEMLEKERTEYLEKVRYKIRQEEEEAYLKNLIEREVSEKGVLGYLFSLEPKQDKQLNNNGEKIWDFVKNNYNDVRKKIKEQTEEKKKINQLFSQDLKNENMFDENSKQSYLPQGIYHQPSPTPWREKESKYINTNTFEASRTIQWDIGSLRLPFSHIVQEGLQPGAQIYLKGIYYGGDMHFKIHGILDETPYRLSYLGGISLLYQETFINDIASGARYAHGVVIHTGEEIEILITIGEGSYLTSVKGYDLEPIPMDIGSKTSNGFKISFECAIFFQDSCFKLVSVEFRNIPNERKFFIEDDLKSMISRTLTVQPEIKNNPFLFIAVDSNPQKIEWRLKIRETWMNSNQTASGMFMVKFVVQKPSVDWLSQVIEFERDHFGDIIYLNQSDAKGSHKLYSAFEWLSQNQIEPTYFMRTVDNLFLFLSKIESSLTSLSVNPYSLIGKIRLRERVNRYETTGSYVLSTLDYVEDSFPSFPEGPVSIITGDFISSILENERNSFRLPMADVSLGLWANNTVKNLGIAKSEIFLLEEHHGSDCHKTNSLFQSAKVDTFSCIQARLEAGAPDYCC